jgi:hypothetical protein
LMIAELCWALTIVKASPSRLTVPPMFIGSAWPTPWPPRCMQISRSIQQFEYDNSDHALDICGIVFNHTSYSVGPEGRTSLDEVQEEAMKNGWHIFQTQIRYSRSYAKAAREGTAIGSTSNVQWHVTGEFSRFVDEFFQAIGLRQTR